MRICMVSRHGCIRVFKQSLALLNAGHEVELLAQGTAVGFNKLRRMSIFFDDAQLKRAIQASDADVIHVHNEPDWMVRSCREVTDRPIVFDCHDLQSLRTGQPPDSDEIDAFAMADAFVHVSEPCRAAAVAAHPASATKPTIVLHSYINEEFLDKRDDRQPSWTSLVYEGGLSTEVVNRPEVKGTPFTLNLRSLQDVVAGFIEQWGFNVFLLPASPITDVSYENMGAAVIGPLPYPTMLRALRAFGFGFVGTVASSPLMEAALPNKLFEYISQGVVPVIWHARTASAWAEEHGKLAITLTDADEDVRTRLLAEGPEVRARIIARRREFTMERQVSMSETLYEQIVGAPTTA